jgi:hypothetical protein
MKCFRIAIAPVLAVVLALGAGFALAQERKEEGRPPAAFTALFNGKDLSGFKVTDAVRKHWTVKDGVLDLNPEGKKGDLTLWTEQQFGDVTLLLDWRWSGPAKKMQRPVILPSGDEKKDENGKTVTVEIEERDSGIYLRGSSKAQVNLWAWPVGSGEVYGYRTDRNQPAEVRAGVTPKKAMDKPVGEWNRMEITIKGDRLTVKLNGEEVISEAQLPGVPARGAIALQEHGQHIQFRNIYFKELP